MGKIYVIFSELYMKMNLFNLPYNTCYIYNNFQLSITLEISSKPVHGGVYLIQLCMRTLVSDLRRV